jgi:uncharacterized membrane protein YhaH (DUF805 family)
LLTIKYSGDLLYSMRWLDTLFSVVIVLLYIPMVFLGANVFFSEYTGSDSWYRGDECLNKIPRPTVDQTELQREELVLERDACTTAQNNARIAFEDSKRDYEGNKYVFIVIFNLVILLAALAIPRLQDAVVSGLFLGSTLTTFFATIGYFETRSKIGFVILVITFGVIIYFINKSKDKLLPYGATSKKVVSKKKK